MPGLRAFQVRGIRILDSRLWGEVLIKKGPCQAADIFRLFGAIFDTSKIPSPKIRIMLQRAQESHNKTNAGRAFSSQPEQCARWSVCILSALWFPKEPGPLMTVMFLGGEMYVKRGHEPPLCRLCEVCSEGFSKLWALDLLA